MRWASRIVGVALVLGVAGCAPRPSPHRQAASPVQTASGPHNWSYRKGQDYAYEAVVPADPKKHTASASAVQVYRYLGVHRGLYKLKVGGETATCPNPCQIVTLHSGFFHVERLAYDPDSLIAAAFEDAFGGRLEMYDPTKGG